MAINEADWKLIELVYMYHPSMECTDPKKRIAKIYCYLGMAVVKDMENRALEMRKIENEMNKLRFQIDELHRYEQRLREGEAV